LERTYFSSNNNARFDILTALYNLEQDCNRLVADREALLRRHNRLIMTVNQLNDKLFEQNEQQAKDRRFNQLLAEDTTRQKSAIKTLQQEIAQTKQSIAHVSSKKTQAEQDLLTTKLWSNHKKREHANAVYSQHIQNLTLAVNGLGNKIVDLTKQNNNLLIRIREAVSTRDAESKEQITLKQDLDKKDLPTVVHPIQRKEVIQFYEEVKRNGKAAIDEARKSKIVLYGSSVSFEQLLKGARQLSRENVDMKSGSLLTSEIERAEQKNYFMRSLALSSVLSGVITAGVGFFYLLEG